MDKAWWDIEDPKFSGEKLTFCQTDKARQIIIRGDAKNSGAAAITLAKARDADKVILLGYDCKFDADGKTHWHGDHKKGLGNAGSLGNWPNQYLAIAKHVKGLDIVNCTRDTALTLWPLRLLEDELC